MVLQNIRQNYDHPALRRSDLAADPFDQFATWFANAQAADILEPNAMTLATVCANGTPAARTMLLKGVDDANTLHRGFVFFTNYTSAKAKHLALHPHAALNFHWDTLARTVRITGSVAQVSADETAAYFHSRPRSSQIGAWCSHQSNIIETRDILEAKQRELEAKHPSQHPHPRPPFLGRLPRHPHNPRVLARPTLTPTRPLPLHPRR